MYVVTTLDASDGYGRLHAAKEQLRWCPYIYRAILFVIWKYLLHPSEKMFSTNIFNKYFQQMFLTYNIICSTYNFHKYFQQIFSEQKLKKIF